MIGIWKAYATIYLYIIAIGTLLCFGLPMMLQPLRWARVLGWQIPEHTHLAIYFGRCLGAVICVLAAFAISANNHEATRLFYFNIILSNFVAMVGVHVYGAIKRIQPLIENLEIIYWGLLIVITLLFYPR